jgi:hypothetical protein
VGREAAVFFAGRGVELLTYGEAVHKNKNKNMNKNKNKNVYF